LDALFRVALRLLTEGYDRHPFNRRSRAIVASNEYIAHDRFPCRDVSFTTILAGLRDDGR
jgi:hypothetical protein